MNNMNNMNNMNMMNNMNNMNMMNNMNNMNMMNMMGMMGMNNNMANMNNMNMMNNMNPNMMNMMGMMGMNNNMGNMNMGDMPTGNIIWTLIFTTKSGQKISVQVSPDELVSKAIERYRFKTGDMDKNEYIYNGHKVLAAEMKVSQSGLNNGSEISVLSVRGVEGA